MGGMMDGATAPLPSIGIYDREGYCCCSAMCCGYEAINGGSSQYITVGEPAYKRKRDEEYRLGLDEMRPYLVHINTTIASTGVVATRMTLHKTRGFGHPDQPSRPT